MKALSICMILFLVFTAGLSAQGAPVYVWWEGENYKETTSTDPIADVPGNNKPSQQEKLSGGKWMTPRAKKGAPPVTITYEVEVPEEKEYNFYVRKFWKHGPFKWKFDDQEWKECGKRIALLDNTFLQKHWGANWVSLGQVKLTAGTHTLNIEMIDNNGCFDCWLLIDGPFSPMGKLKPGEKTNLHKPGWFAWEPDADPQTADCVIDVSHLNKTIKGFVKKQGNGFVDPDGDPVRFWMVQGGGLMSMDRKTTDFWAKRLAKYGVNLNRLQFSGLFKAYTAGDMKTFNEILDDVHYVVSALKKNGIYCYFGHLYWQTHVSLTEKVAGPGYGGGKGKKPLELLFFDEKFQAYFKKFISDVMNKENPYTGLPMSKDPAVAFVEIQNESSLFFWTFKPGSMVPQTLRLMETAWTDWVKKKYETIEAAKEAWGPEKYPKRPSADTADRLGVYGVGFLTGADWARAQSNTKRVADQRQFMVEWQKDFYTKMVKDMKEEIGLQNMVSCSNWKTADPKHLGMFERYTYTPGDVICRNAYYGVSYKPKPKRFYAIDLGDTFKGISALKPPAMPAPLTVGHVNDHPYMITENCWTRPNRFRSEWPFLIATYAQMMGVDGWNFFALGSSVWQTPMAVWELNSPCIFGQFPATSLIFRKGYVKEAGYAVTDKQNLNEMYNFKAPYLFELGGQDDLWVSKIGDLEAEADAAAKQEPMAFFVGKINQIPTDEPSELTTVDFSQYIDPKAKTVKSMTGELMWDYGKGIVTVNAPKAQGAAGFLGKGGKISLGDIDIECDMEYGTILAVALDDKPLAQSGKILIQAATEDLPYGFETRKQGDYHRITNLGGHPLNVKLIKASVTLKSKSGTATVLDGNGYKTDKKAQTEPSGTGIKITLPEDSIYTVVE